MFVAVVGIAILHSHGYRIYGYAHMYRSDPPSGEGWIKVVEMKRDHFTLEDDTKISLHPFHLTDQALALTPEQLSKRLFILSSDDIYVRREGNVWILRNGNAFLTASRSFFPKRYYGYYENELLESIANSGVELNVPLGKGLVGADSEEAVERFYKNEAYQDGGHNSGGSASSIVTP